MLSALVEKGVPEIWFGFVSVGACTDDALPAIAGGGFLRFVFVSCILLSPNPLRLCGEGYVRYLKRTSGLDAQRRLAGQFLQHPHESRCSLVGFVRVLATST